MAFLKQSIREILDYRLGMNKITEKWVPDLLYAFKRERQVKFESQCLNMYGDDP